VALGGKSQTRLDEDLDQIIEENFNLQEEERKLMSQVKKLQAKKQQSINVTTEQVKKLSHTMQNMGSPNKPPQRHQS
jgi:regulator of replication initiation timing